MIYHTPQSITIFWDAAPLLIKPLTDEQLDYNIKTRLADSGDELRPHEQKRSQDQGAE